MEDTSMDIGLNTLLVALMFVTVLSMGIGNVLVTLADIVNHANKPRRDRVHLAWIVLVLLIHFNVFWHTKSILAVEEWAFGGFLLTIAGPVLLFFATSILLTNPGEGEQADSASFFRGIGSRFFLMFALLQGWIVVADYVLGGGLGKTDLVNVAYVILGLMLARIDQPRVQVFGVVLAWLLGIGGLMLSWG